MVAQAAAVDVLHGDEQPRFRFPEVIDAHDGWMIELGRGARFLNQTGAELILPSEMAVHELDRHLPLQIEVRSAIDRAHASITQQGIEAIAFI